MAYFKIDEPNQPTKWIKEVDNANGKLVFQDTRDNAYYQDSGFFADSELEYLKFHFTKEYPELEFMTIDYGHDWADAPVEAAQMMEEADVPGDAAW